MTQDFDRNRYESLFSEVIKDLEGEEERVYMQTHKERFFEAFEQMATYLPNVEKPRVCEFGTSNFTILFKKIWPHIELVTVDRPVKMFGFPAEWAIENCAADHHYNINLNTDSIGPEWGEPPIGAFDFVLFCEILEHLPISGAQLVEELVSLLKPNGLLYLTTPNFFSMHALQKISHRKSPVEQFPRRNEDTSASMHFREYTLDELVQFANDAGGRVVKAIYSTSMFNEQVNSALEKRPEYSSNLMLIVGKPEGEQPIEQIMLRETLNAESMLDESNPDQLLSEIERLTTLVESYENGRVIRMIKWLREKGLPV
ncbi:MAG: methyltransferase domain-containing protein [Chloroflexota bacterium]